MLVVANRIFEIWLYNYYLSTAERSNRKRSCVSDYNMLL